MVYSCSLVQISLITWIPNYLLLHTRSYLTLYTFKKFIMGTAQAEHSKYESIIFASIYRSRIRRYTRQYLGIEMDFLASYQMTLAFL